MKKESFLRPNPIKIAFTVVFLIPLFTFIFLTSFNFISALVVGVIISYFLASLSNAVYQKCGKRWIKAILIIVATIVSLGAAFFIFLWLTQPIVCDPVHRPTECEIACEKIYENVANIPEAVRQKYYECIGKCFEQI
jgi:hypothetical protein